MEFSLTEGAGLDNSHTRDEPLESLKQCVEPTPKQIRPGTVQRREQTHGQKTRR